MQNTFIGFLCFPYLPRIGLASFWAPFFWNSIAVDTFWPVSSFVLEYKGSSVLDLANQRRWYFFECSIHTFSSFYNARLHELSRMLNSYFQQLLQRASVRCSGNCSTRQLHVLENRETCSLIFIDSILVVFSATNCKISRGIVWLFEIPDTWSLMRSLDESSCNTMSGLFNLMPRTSRTFCPKLQQYHSLNVTRWKRMLLNNLYSVILWPTSPIEKVSDELLYKVRSLVMVRSCFVIFVNFKLRQAFART